MSERFGVQPKFDLKTNWLDEALLKYQANFRDKFSQHWMSHQCITEGCGWALVSDGGLKLHRPVCAAKVIHPITVAYYIM